VTAGPARAGAGTLPVRDFPASRSFELVGGTHAVPGPHAYAMTSPPAPALPSDAAAAPAAMPAQQVLGIPLALTDYAGTLDWIDHAVQERAGGYICVAAVHTVMAAREDPELLAAVLGADFTVPDGQPLVWAVNLLGGDLPSRVYGPELMDLACARAARTGRRFYLYGGRDPAALAQLVRTLRLRHPGLRIVGGHAPPFRPLTAAEEEAVAADIRRSGADVVWVGIGVPKQEKWMARMRDRLEAPVLVGVGAAFDFHAGLVPQAPAALQRLGLEWLFRLAHEPRRLWRRYLRYNPRFVIGFLRQYAAHRATRG
jgi:N-acetylglucosaminyldiphosphoundecaprenol N-acetyl-beta-D-mannosaminyltransferase